jgi:hypothetical protein
VFHVHLLCFLVKKWFVNGRCMAGKYMNQCAP